MVTEILLLDRPGKHMPLVRACLSGFGLVERTGLESFWNFGAGHETRVSSGTGVVRNDGRLALFWGFKASFEAIGVHQVHVHWPYGP